VGLTLFQDQLEFEACNHKGGGAVTETESSFVFHYRQRALTVVFLTAIALVGTASAQTVDAPASNDPYVNSPFYLQAEAPTCSSLPTTSMAYSYDNHADVMFKGAQSIQAVVTITDDPAPTLYVKAWSTNGDLCMKTLHLNIGGGVTVSSPAQDGTVSGNFHLTAQAATCGGQTTSSMAYTVDSNKDTVVTGAKSLNTTVSAPAGWHILRVKAWGDGGAYCETDVHIDNGGGIQPPLNANSEPNLETDGTYPDSEGYQTCGNAKGPDTNLWQTQPDCGTFNTTYKNQHPSFGSTSQVSTPVYGGNSKSRDFTMSYYDIGEGVRWFDARLYKTTNPNDDLDDHFLYDTYVYIPDVTQVENIEMDVNHSVSSTNTLYILAAQCSLDAGVWEVTVNHGWKQTDISCQRSTVTPGTWHHFQIETHHDSSGSHYDAVALDGVVSNVTCAQSDCGVNPPTVPGWGGVLGPNFQLDGEKASPDHAGEIVGTATAYVNNFTIYHWH
jgi:hypothetical protein